MITLPLAPQVFPKWKPLDFPGQIPISSDCWLPENERRRQPCRFVVMAFKRSPTSTKPTVGVTPYGCPSPVSIGVRGGLRTRGFKPVKDGFFQDGFG